MKPSRKRTKAVSAGSIRAIGEVSDIAEQKQGQEELRRNQEELQSVLASIPDYLWSADIDNQGHVTYRYYSPVVEKITGRPPEFYMPGPERWLSTVHPDDRTRLQGAVKSISAGLVPMLTEEYRIVLPDETVRWVRDCVQVRWEEGRCRVDGVVSDVTERKRAEEALRHSEATRGEVLLAAQMGVWEWTMATDTITWDENLDRIAGRDPKSLIPSGQKAPQIFTAESWERLKVAAENTLVAGTPFELDMELVRPDGSTRWLIGRGGPVRDTSGQITHLRGTVQDITERKRTAEALRESEERFRTTFENAGVGMALVDMYGHPIKSNPALQQTLGYSEEELSRKVFTEFTHPDDRELDWRLYGELTAGKREQYEIEKRFLKKDGGVVWGLLTASLVKGRHGRPIYCVAMVQDISERKRAEEALRESEERFRQIAETIDEVFWTADPNISRMFYVSPAYERVWGRSVASLYEDPKSFLEAIHADDRERVLADREVHKTGQAFDHEYRVAVPGGEVRWIWDRGFPVRDGAGQVIRYVGVAVDVTGRKILEQKLQQAAKMEAVGRLAGGVAHDFNNLLTVITGYGELVLDRLHSDDPIRGHLNEIMKAGGRAASLTRQLLAFSRQQVMAPRVLDLNALVADVGKMLHRLIGEDIDLVVVPGAELGRVKADPGQVEQILMNLAVNARDAMPQGGKLIIEMTNVELDEDYADGHPVVLPGHYVMLAMSDSGTGMDVETQSHIFEPFFTTKEKGKGTGLGLATVYGIVKQSGGYVWVYSEPGEGTTFKIYLPRVEEAGESVQFPEAQGHPVAASETILLVEDEEALRALAVRILQGLGYKVLESTSPEDALQISEQHTEPIHLLLTDVVLPGMSGRKVAELLAPLRPDMKVLYMSGYTDDAIVRSGVLEATAAFLQKPFTPAILARKVREVLDTGREHGS